MTAAQWGGSALAIRFTTVVLPEPEPPAIPMIIISFFTFLPFSFFTLLPF
jgi:hypothetical protein